MTFKNHTDQTLREIESLYEKMTTPTGRKFMAMFMIGFLAGLMVGGVE